MTPSISRLACLLAVLETMALLSGTAASPLPPMLGALRAALGIPPPAQRGGEPRVPATDTPFVILRKSLEGKDGTVRNVKFYRVNATMPVSRSDAKRHDHLSRIVIRAFKTPTSPLGPPSEFTRLLTEKEIIALNLAKNGAAVQIPIPEMRKFVGRGARHFSVDSKLWAQEIQGTTPVGNLKLSAHSGTVEPVNAGGAEKGADATDLRRSF